jgi:hypothetical protein
MTKMGRERLRQFIAAVLSIGVLALAGAARAGGRVEWKSKTLKENSNHWTIDVSIYLNKAPDVGTLPMRFSFEPVVYYERALMDGKDGPQERKVPLEGKPPLVESVDVGFMDPGSGKIEKRTKFNFQVTRGHGFEAGEYDVTIRDGRTDVALGSPTHLIFEGENEVVDRRAMVFSGDDKKKKAKDDSDGDKKDDAPKKKELTPDDPGYWEGGPKNTEQQEKVEPKSGCGCRVQGGNARMDELGVAAAALALGIVGLRRRRG